MLTNPLYQDIVIYEILPKLSRDDLITLLRVFKRVVYRNAIHLHIRKCIYESHSMHLSPTIPSESKFALAFNVSIYIAHPQFIRMIWHCIEESPDFIALKVIDHDYIGASVTPMLIALEHTISVISSEPSDNRMDKIWIMRKIVKHICLWKNALKLDFILIRICSYYTLHLPFGSMTTIEILDIMINEILYCNCENVIPFDRLLRISISDNYGQLFDYLYTRHNKRIKYDTIVDELSIAGDFPCSNPFLSRLITWKHLLRK